MSEEGNVQQQQQQVQAPSSTEPVKSVITPVQPPSATARPAVRGEGLPEFGVLIRVQQDMTTPGGKHIQDGTVSVCMMETLFAEPVEDIVATQYLDILKAQSVIYEPELKLLMSSWSALDFRTANAERINALKNLTEQYAKEVKPLYEVPCFRIVKGEGKVSPSARSQTRFSYATLSYVPAPREYYGNEDTKPTGNMESMNYNTPDFFHFKVSNKDDPEIARKGIVWLETQSKDGKTVYERVTRAGLPDKVKAHILAMAPVYNMLEVKTDGVIYPSKTTLVHPNWSALLHVLFDKLANYFSDQDNVYKNYAELIMRMRPFEIPTLENIPEHPAAQLLLSLFYVADALGFVSKVDDFNSMDIATYWKLLVLIKCSRVLRRFATLPVEIEPSFKIDFQDLRRREEIVELLNWACELLNHCLIKRPAYTQRSFVALSKRWASTYSHKLKWRVEAQGESSTAATRLKGIYNTGTISLKQLSIPVMRWGRVTDENMPQAVTTADFRYSVEQVPMVWVVPTEIYERIHTIIGGSPTDTVMLLSLSGERQKTKEESQITGVYQILASTHAASTHLTYPVPNFIIAKSTEAQKVKGHVITTKDYLEEYAILHEPIALPSSIDIFEF